MAKKPTKKPAAAKTPRPKSTAPVADARQLAEQAAPQAVRTLRALMQPARAARPGDSVRRTAAIAVLGLAGLQAPKRTDPPPPGPTNAEQIDRLARLDADELDAVEGLLLVLEDLRAGVDEAEGLRPIVDALQRRSVEAR